MARPEGAQSGAPGADGSRDRILPWAKVRDITGLSRTTAWRRQKAGDFPLPIQISPGRVGWRESELTAWKSSRAPRQPAAAQAITKTAPPPARLAGVPLGQIAPPSGASVEAPMSPRRSKARTPAGCEGQIAFEF